MRGCGFPKSLKENFQTSLLKGKAQSSPVHYLILPFFTNSSFHSYHFLFSFRGLPTMASPSMSKTPRKEDGKNLSSGMVGSPITPKPSPTSQVEIMDVARNFSDQPLQNPDPGVWAVLTAISKKSRQRPQGMNMILNGDDHCIGRLVKDVPFQIVHVAVSAYHCKIFRARLPSGDDGISADSRLPAFLKDTSTNGTFLNWKRLTKSSPQTMLRHGDIISFVTSPHEENAYAFVYREVCKSICLSNVPNLKRKADGFGSERKRTKGIGIGAADGPISLDDVRSLQRSNMELRKQLESHVHTIEALNSENRAFATRRENELKDVKESVSSSLKDQIKELQCKIDSKQKELVEAIAKSVENQNSINDLNERLLVSEQSRADSDEIIHSQKARILELEAQLDEERNQRKDERENAAADLKSALHKVKTEAQDEIKRQADTHTRQNREQEEKINKLQESEKEKRVIVDTLRSKLEDNREKFVMSEKKVRQLEAQVQEEKLASENIRKRLEAVESDRKRLKNELEIEKGAREEAWAKVSVLELEIAAANHELSNEKQRLQGARERVILRETQLRAFYSTTEEISALFLKQQEQLKAMQKTLEDEENCENTSIGFDLNVCQKENSSETLHRDMNNAHTSNPEKDPCTDSKNVRMVAVTSNNDSVSSTQKHDCDFGSQDDNATQDMECTSAGRLPTAFGSDIDCFGTAAMPEGELVGTEQVLETESPIVDVGMDEQNIILHKCSGNLGGETMQLDDGAHGEDNLEKHQGPRDVGKCSLSSLDDTEACTVRTEDLLASEVPGSWENSTAPSVHGEHDSSHCTGSDDENDDDVTMETPLFLNGQAQRSQINASDMGASRLREEHLALNAMIGIVAPELKEQFQRQVKKSETISDAETEEGSNHSGSSGDEDDDDDVIENSVG